MQAHSGAICSGLAYCEPRRCACKRGGAVSARFLAAPASAVGLTRLLATLIALGFSAAAVAQGYLGKLLDDFNEVKALSQRKQRIEFASKLAPTATRQTGFEINLSWY